jgi:hypothetical protein
MNLHEQVLVMVHGTSEKYVPELGNVNDILSDGIIGLWRFSNSCRWKKFWRLTNLEEARESDSSPKSVNCKGFFESEVIGEAKRQGLNSNLKAKNRTNSRVPKGSKDLEAFLSAVDKEIMDQIFDKGNGYKPKPKLEDIKVVNRNLKFTSTVSIPTDKTNSFKCIHIDDYKNWSIKHLLKNEKEIPRSKLVQVFEDANSLLESLEQILSEYKLQSNSSSKTTD